MTKTELMKLLAEQEVDVIKRKQALYDEMETCFDNLGNDINPDYYEELQKVMEFLNGQQALIGSQVNLFKLNKGKYYDLVNALDMERIRNNVKLKYVSKYKSFSIL
jgi:hypothetical protein